MGKAVGKRFDLGGIEAGSEGQLPESIAKHEEGEVAPHLLLVVDLLPLEEQPLLLDLEHKRTESA